MAILTVALIVLCCLCCVLAVKLRDITWERDQWRRRAADDHLTVGLLSKLVARLGEEIEQRRKAVLSDKVRVN